MAGTAEVVAAEVAAAPLPARPAGRDAAELAAPRTTGSPRAPPAATPEQQQAGPRHRARLPAGRGALRAHRHVRRASKPAPVRCRRFGTSRTLTRRRSLRLTTAPTTPATGVSSSATTTRAQNSSSKAVIPAPSASNELVRLEQVSFGKVLELRDGTRLEVGNRLVELVSPSSSPRVMASGPRSHPGSTRCR